MPIFCQPGDEGAIAAHGFHDVTPIAQSVEWNGVSITRVAGQHGSGEVLSDLGQASGFVLRHPQEPSVYWAGDSIWCDAVAGAIQQFQPAIIVTHSCGAVWGKGVFIVMDAEQTVQVCESAPNSKIVATHMDSVDHATVSREQLRAVARAHNISDAQLLIPQDGETLVF
jgi:L-ascorbate metabolism protein UlaG (beta-lactamase superfamily)